MLVSEAISLSADTAPRHLSEHVGTRDHLLPAVGYVPRDHRSRAVIGSGLFLAAMQVCNTLRGVRPTRPSETFCDEVTWYRLLMYDYVI